MSSSLLQRRQLLRLLAGSAAALPLSGLFPRRGAAAGPNARRIIFFYAPDGVHEADWGLEGRQLSALGEQKRNVVLLRNVTMSQGEGHNDGAKQLLKGNLDPGTSFDQYLANTFGASTYYQHLALGAQAHATPPGSNGDDWFISYRNGSPVPPEDNPVAAFGRLFPNGQIPSVPVGPGMGMPTPIDPALLRDRSVLDVVLADLNDLRGRLDAENLRKLDLHLEATREAERRIGQLTGEGGSGPGGIPPGVVGQCDAPSLAFEGGLYDAARFPDVLAAQLDVMVMAMACGLTRVGTIQCSRHTSPLSMPFVGSSRVMQSHEASHNDGNVFLDQRVWFFRQFKALLDKLDARTDPDVPGATMLETTLVLFCTEINFGPTHKHVDMPFVLAGGSGGSLRSGRAFDAGGRHHSQLMATLARALGTDANGWLGGQHGTVDGLI